MLALTMALTVFYFAVGVLKIVGAFRIRPSSTWGWVLLSGLVSLFLAAIIWLGMPLYGILGYRPDCRNRPDHLRRIVAHDNAGRADRL